jgi:SpoVK/Ycf46/Vps4 family AAA+-type ATPase
VTLKDGLLLVGVPGAGKSATVKFIGKELSLPVIEFQVEKVHNPYLGMSESNLAAVFELAENMAPCILFFDELEKLFGGKTGQVHETTDRMKGQFLKFVNDTIASVIVIATVNKTDAIAPEMLRAGRFNKWLFFDLLTYEERLEVFKLHIELDRTPDTDENDIYPPDREGAKDRIIRVADNFDVVTFAKRTENFTGAEIEQVVIQAIGNAFDLDLPDVNNELIERAILNMTPIAIRQPEYIKEIQKFGYKNCELANNSAASKQRQDEELKILASEAVQQNNADRSRFN